MFFNVYKWNDGSITYGLGHPSKEYARAVRFMSSSDKVHLGVLWRK
jgi:hypothetical protein